VILVAAMSSPFEEFAVEHAWFWLRPHVTLVTSPRDISFVDDE